MNSKYIKFALYLIVIVLLNMVSDTLFVRIDLTKNKKYSISEVSKDLVKNLTVPLTIKVFFTPDLPAPHNNTERFLRDLLEEYSSYANHNFNFEFLSVSAKKDQSLSSIGNQSVAESYDIKPSGIRIVEEDQESIKFAYRGLVMINGDMIEKIPVIESTDGLEYKITMAMRRLNNKISVLSSLKGKIKVKFCMSDSLVKIAPLIKIPDISKAPDQVKTKVEELNRKYFNRIEYEYINPSKINNPQLEEQLKKDGVFSMGWKNIPQKGIAAGKGFIGMIVSYNDNKISIPVLQEVRIPIVNIVQYQYSLKENLEYLPQIVEAVLDINQDIGFLSSHSGYTLRGRSRQSRSLDSFDMVLSGNYTTKEIDLTKDRINENLKSLIIANPTKKFTDYELYQIDQALMRGTNLAFFIDPFEERAASRQLQMMGRRTEFFKIDTGLEKLLKHYGVIVKKSFVMDEECYKVVDPNQGEVKVYYIPVIDRKNINKSLPFMKDILGLVTMRAAPLEITEEKRKDPDLKIFRLFTTSEKSWEVKSNFNLQNPKAIRVPNDAKTMGKKDMAYLLEGKFESYFKGKEIPVKTIDKKDTKKAVKSSLKGVKTLSENSFIPERKNGKIFVIGTSKIIDNELFDKEGVTPNSVFIMNVIDSLNDLDSIAEMRGKNKGYNPIAKTDAITKALLKGFNIAVVPLLVILFGGFIWLRRSQRKKKLKNEFMKSN